MVMAAGTETERQSERSHLRRKRFGMKILVVFALQSEFAPWRREPRYGWRQEGSGFLYLGSAGNAEIRVALAGMGGRRADRVIDAAARYEPHVGMVAGLAGGLKPEWRSGDVLVAESVGSPAQTETAQSDPRLFRLAVACGAKPAGRFLTLLRIACTAREKSLLAEAGDAADMESLLLMPRLSRLGIPVVAVRAIADSAETDMPCDFEGAADDQGEIRTGKLLAQLVRRPQSLPGFVRLGVSSLRAAQALARYLDRFIERLGDKESLRDLRTAAGAACTR